MTEKQYNIITGLCLFAAIISGVLIDELPQYKYWFMTMAGVTALIAIVTYFTNLWNPINKT